MKVERYAQFVKHGNFTKNDRDAIFLGAMGLNGEAGEVSEILKKHLIHGDDLDRDHLRQELGDVCWYLLHTMNTFGFTFNEVIEANVVKLCDRHYPKNGDPEDWINPFGPDLGNI